MVVLTKYRRRGITGKLIQKAEKIVFHIADTVGIGIGLSPDYGIAQRMFVKNGFIPDGRGVQYDEKTLSRGEQTRVDDCLNLFFTKKRKTTAC